MRRAFTLVELIAVVLIIGIIAAVAAPKLFDATDDARESALVHSLSVVRDAIELYKATNGALPGEAGTEADLKADLAPFLPRFVLNPLKDSDVVAVKTDGAPITGTISGGAGWLYDNVTGQFVANSNGMSADGINRYFEL